MLVKRREKLVSLEREKVSSRMLGEKRKTLEFRLETGARYRQGERARLQLGRAEEKCIEKGESRVCERKTWVLHNSE